MTQTITRDAYGTIIFDDGISNENLEQGNYTQVEYSFYSYNSSYDILASTKLSFGYERKAKEWPYISSLIFYGCTAVPEAVYMFSRGSTTIINKAISWDLEHNVCKIWFDTTFEPDMPATIFIDYYI